MEEEGNPREKNETMAACRKYIGQMMWLPTRTTQKADGLTKIFSGFFLKNLCQTLVWRPFLIIYLLYRSVDSVDREAVLTNIAALSPRVVVIHGPIKTGKSTVFRELR